MADDLVLHLKFEEQLAHIASKTYADLSADSDVDGVPDFLEEDVADSIPNIVKDTKYARWEA